MAFQYVNIEDAIESDGLRMVVMQGVPSGWSEAAKGILHIKNIDWSAVRLTYDNEALKKWAGQRNGPIAIYNNERPRSGWAEILLLAERLSSTQPLIPENSEDRALVFGLAHEICGEAGLGWSRRLQVIHAGGFPDPVAKHLGMKYGYSSEAGLAASNRVCDILNMLVTRLKTQRTSGSAFLVGNSLTAVDIYSATFFAMFSPLPHEQCPMDSMTRKAFELRDAKTEAALDPILFEHRDMIYEKYLELPLSI